MNNSGTLSPVAYMTLEVLDKNISVDQLMSVSKPSLVYKAKTTLHKLNH